MTEHQSRCKGCGKPATRTCDHGIPFSCGEPLCDQCEHLIDLPDLHGNAELEQPMTDLKKAPKPGDRCQVWTINDERVRVVEYEGTFLGWSQNYEEFETGPGNYPVAIVRRGSKIELPYAGSVEFPDD